MPPWRIGAHGAALSAVALIAVLAEALHQTRGHYKTNRVIFVTLALAGFAVATWRRDPAEPGAEPPGRPLALLHGLGAALLLVDARLLYASPGAVHDALRLLAGVNLMAAMGLAYTAWRPSPDGLRRGFAVLALVALVLARPLVLWASPSPHIDVFTTTDRAVDFLLSGSNPYAQSYPDIYGGRYDYAPGLVYWPGTVLIAAAGKLAFSDLRAAYIVADLAGAAAIYRLAGAGRRTFALTAAATWLSFPVSLFILEQAWVDPAVLAALLWVAVALRAQRYGWAGLLLGVATAVKQPAAVAAVMTGLLVLWTRPRKVGPLIAGGLAALALIVVPFALDDPQGLWRMTITVPLTQAMRSDAFTFLALAQREWGLAISGVVSGALYAATLGLVLVRIARRPGWGAGAWLSGMALLYGVVFLFGKQAFCNYWALVAGLALAALVVRETAPDG